MRSKGCVISADVSPPATPASRCSYLSCETKETELVFLTSSILIRHTTTPPQHMIMTLYYHYMTFDLNGHTHADARFLYGFRACDRKVFMEVEREKKEEKATFSYQFSSNGTRYTLRVPVRGLLGGARARELASRVVSAHNLPCYLEDELCSQLEAFARDTAFREWDCEGDELVKLAGSSSEVSVRSKVYDVMMMS